MIPSPLVSIFIPAYNAERTIKQAIDSVQAQTYQNYELILLNDASTDQTGEIINQYKALPNVKVYHNLRNLGVAANWNKGVSLCQGDFIVRLDADDFYEPTYLEKVMAVQAEYPDIDLLFTGAKLLQSTGDTTTDLFYKESWIRSGKDFLPELLQVCHIWSPTACVSRRAYERLGGVIEKMDIHEDWEFWVRVTANGQVGYIAEPLTNIRTLNQGGCTTSAILEARSPICCDIWLQHLNQGDLPYHLNQDQLALLKKGMYNIVMAFAVFAMEGKSEASVQKHLTFAETLLPTHNQRAMQAQLYDRAAEMYFMNGGLQHFKGWYFLLRSLRYGLPRYDHYKTTKLWGRAILGKRLFEFLREYLVIHRKFPYVSEVNE